MSLRIRRGSDAERLAVRFDQGEIVWVNSTTTSRPAYKLYVGDGTTYGGRDIVETSAGNKLTYNTNTGRLDVSGLTTDDIAPGTNNKFFTPELAQDAVGAMFAAGTMSGITFVYDDVGNKMNVTVTATGSGGGGSGIAALLNDPSPTLGGTLHLNNHNITGTGDVNITGNLISSGTITATTGLGANLTLNGFDLTGTGNVNITGDLHASGQLNVAGGLGHDLALNGFNITGNGGLIINGTILTATGLGGNLPLNSHNITGNGNIILDSGSLTLTSGTATITSGDVVVTAGTITAPTITATSTLKTALIVTPTTDNLLAVGTSASPLVATNIYTNSVKVYGASTTGNNGSSITHTLYSSRGTVDAPTANQVGDYLGGFSLFGHNNSAYIPIALITATIDTVTGSENFPGTLQLGVRGANSTFTGAVINSKGVLTIPTLMAGDGSATNPSIGFTTDGSQDSGFFHPGDGIVCVTTNGVERARFDGGGIRSSGFIKVAQVSGTLPSPPEAGMIVLDGTTFKGYNGTSWVALN